MNTTTVAVRHADHRSDLIAARVTGIGVGLITFMITWITTARITDHVAAAPNSAYIAMGIAIATGITTTIVAARRLAASITATGGHLDPRHASRPDTALK